jgi:hypothetical protein
MRQVNPLLARLAAASGDERLVGVTEGILDRQREGCWPKSIGRGQTRRSEAPGQRGWRRTTHRQQGSA